jgi:hypothetical protein
MSSSRDFRSAASRSSCEKGWSLGGGRELGRAASAVMGRSGDFACERRSLLEDLRRLRASRGSSVGLRERPTKKCVNCDDVTRLIEKRWRGRYHW